MKVVTIHQPEHLSYLGFYHKVMMVDTLVLLDHVQYEKRYYQNRNKILTNNGVKFITLPIIGNRTPINEIVFSSEIDKALRKNTDTIYHSYHKAPYWRKYNEEFLYLYNSGGSLSQYNERLIRFILECLDVNVTILRSSELDVHGHKTDLLVDILRKTNADMYVSGISGPSYYDQSKFSIPIKVQNFNHPTYKQQYGDKFEPYLSVIDGLFNVGPNLKELILAANE